MPFPKGTYKFARQRRGDSASTCVEALKFLLKETALIVTFTDGTIYRYDDLPQNVYETFKGASSRGEYFNFNIRLAYPYSRVYSDLDDSEEE